MLIRFIFDPFHIVGLLCVNLLFDLAIIDSIKKTVLIWKLELSYVNLLLLLMASLFSLLCTQEMELPT